MGAAFYRIDPFIPFTDKSKDRQFVFIRIIRDLYDHGRDLALDLFL